MEQRQNTQMQRQPQGQGMARGSITALGQKFTNADALTLAMDELQGRYNVLAPVSRIAALPPGHAITLSVVSIDAEEETYPVEGGKRALSKVALDKIASASGVSWDPRQSGRLDDGSDPHYVSFRAVGTVKDVDGTVRTMFGECEMDMREGSAQVNEIRRRAEMKAREGKKSDPEKEIAQVRTFILRHAESKAKNRAIRSALAVRSAYQPRDLQKPFVCPKLVFTGDFGDAETNRNVNMLIAMNALGMNGTSAAAALYGPGAGPRQPQQAEVRPMIEVDTTGPAKSPPPPVNGTVRRHEDDDDGPPADVLNGEPRPIGELPNDAQVAELVALAARKGKLGDGEGLISEARIARLSPRNRADLWTKLSDLEDEAPAQTDDQAEDEDPIRF